MIDRRVGDSMLDLFFGEITWHECRILRIYIYRKNCFKLSIYVKTYLTSYRTCSHHIRFCLYHSIDFCCTKFSENSICNSFLIRHLRSSHNIFKNKFLTFFMLFIFPKENSEYTRNPLKFNCRVFV